MSRDKNSRRSWTVAVVTFVLIVLDIGVVKCHGVLLPDIREQFATKTWVIGFAIACVPGLGSVVQEYDPCVNIFALHCISFTSVCIARFQDMYIIILYYCVK